MTLQRNFLLISLLICLFISPTLYSAEDDVYTFSWLDKDKEIYVLQNRKYRKDDRLHINLGYGLLTSGAFVDATTIQLRAGYFFHENWGIEFVYGKTSGEENSAARSVRSDGVNAGTTPFRRIVDSYIGGMVMWSPFYSKINTFNKIIYVDWLLGLGFSSLDETNNLPEFKTGQFSTVAESHTALMWDAGMKVYLSKHFELRIDLTVQHFRAPRATRGIGEVGEKIWNSNWDLAGSIGYTF